MIRFSCWIILKVVKHSYHIKNAISKILEFFKKQFWTKSDKKILTLIFLIPFISMIFFVKIRLDLTEKKNTNEKSHFVRYLETVWLFWDETLHKIFFHQCVNFVLCNNRLRAGAWNHLLILLYPLLIKVPCEMRYTKAEKIKKIISLLTLEEKSF